ncbi:unnamed protein product [Cylicocyclus nassatus]|uniref:Uncharacterized protein n=1 Tax=Cylicocyclus nassatus TaxID=53992 RepID=A0AA36M8V4_CYLNA|nr:unnamed protein product [Cylicocyclus nassatus]
MCLFSGSGQVAFAIIMALCIVLTGVAAFKQGEGKLHTWSCLLDEKDCTKLEFKHRKFMQLVAGFVCTSFILEILAMLYNFSIVCLCFFRDYALHPLTWFAFLIFGFLLAAMIIFSAAHNSGNGYYPKGEEYGWGSLCLIFAIILSFLNLIIACVALCFADVSVFSVSL